MELTPDQLVVKMKEADMRYLCLCLLYKREGDGLDGRTWNAGKHLIWEQRISDILKQYGKGGGIK